jgi:hypothetical protein
MKELSPKEPSKPLMAMSVGLTGASVEVPLDLKRFVLARRLSGSLLAPATSATSFEPHQRAG